MVSYPVSESSHIYHCPLCGWGPRKEAYSSVAELRVSYDICECCGCEYGHDDNEEYYAEWVAGDMDWFDERSRPEGWNIDEQSKHQKRPWPPER